MCKLKQSRLKLIILVLVVSISISGCMYQKPEEKEDYIPPVINKTLVFETDEAEEKSTEIKPEEISEIENEDNDFITQESEESLERVPIEHEKSSVSDQESVTDNYIFSLTVVPEFDGNPYVILNNNQPMFSEDEINTTVFERYSRRDWLNRCGVAFANVCPETMPTEERGAIGSVKPSGWHTVKYNDLIDGNYLYNRCHLIGYQLAGENANEDNLITGTRFLNIQGMLPFENMVSGYIEETGNHVLYRVVPIFEGNNLVASGVTMEGFSVEDNGQGICFYIYAYNAQPGIIIDYLTGESWRDPDYQGSRTNDMSNNNSIESEVKKDTSASESIVYPSGSYVLNINTHKFHNPDCGSVSDMADKNKKVSTDTRDEIINQGYEPCKRCNP